MIFWFECVAISSTEKISLFKFLEKAFALNYFEDLILIAETKEFLFTNLCGLQKNRQRQNFKPASTKHFYSQLTEKTFGNESGH